MDIYLNPPSTLLETNSKHHSSVPDHLTLLFLHRGPEAGSETDHKLTEPKDSQHFEIQEDSWKSTDAKRAIKDPHCRVDFHWSHLELHIPHQEMLLLLYSFSKLHVTRIQPHKPTFLHFQHSMEARLSPKCRLNWTVTHKTNIHKQPFCKFLQNPEAAQGGLWGQIFNWELDRFSESCSLSLWTLRNIINMFSFPLTILCVYELELFLLCIWFHRQWGGLDFKWRVSTSVLPRLCFMCYSWLVLQTWLIHRCKCY